MIIVKRSTKEFYHDPELDEFKQYRNSDADQMSVDDGSEIKNWRQKSLPVRDTSMGGGSELQDF